MSPDSHLVGYRRDIDGLRSVAVLLVLVFHFDLLPIRAGFIGVDLFFVISGYLISSIIWRDLGRDRFSFGRFYLRRIRRLAPALMVVQVAVLALAAMLLLPLEVLSLVKESLFVQLYLSNIYYWRTLDYFGLQASGSFMLHTWSLAIEEQFYLFYPLLLVAVHRWARRRLYLVLALVCAGSFALNLWLLPLKPQATFYLLPTRAWELGIGALIPALEPAFASNKRLRVAGGWGAALLLVGALVLYAPGTPFPGWFALAPTAAGALFILAGTAEGGPVSRLLALPLPVWIGRISYPLYLVHWPLHIFALTLLPSYGPVARWAMFGLSILLAWLVNRLVERPVKMGTAWATDWRLATGYGGSVALVLAVIASGWATGGWRGRFSPSVLQVADAAADADDAENALDASKLGRLQDGVRRIGAPGVEPHWLVFGDSHAAALKNAFSRWLAGRREAGVLVFAHGCLPLLDTGDGRCRRFNRDVHDYIRAHPEIGAVFLASIWHQPLEEGFSDREGRTVGRSEALVAFDASLRATLEALRRERVKTFVWAPLPRMPLPVPQTMARNLMFSRSLPIEAPLAEHARTFRFLDEALTRDASLVAGRVNPALRLCPQGVCRGAIDGRPLFWDTTHPANGRSAVFADILTEQMRDVPRARGRDSSE